MDAGRFILEASFYDLKFIWKCHKKDINLLVDEDEDVYLCLGIY